MPLTPTTGTGSGGPSTNGVTNRLNAGSNVAMVSVPNAMYETIGDFDGRRMDSVTELVMGHTLTGGESGEDDTNSQQREEGEGNTGGIPYVPWGFYFGSCFLTPPDYKDQRALKKVQQLVQYIFDHCEDILPYRYVDTEYERYHTHYQENGAEGEENREIASKPRLLPSPPHGITAPVSPRGAESYDNESADPLRPRSKSDLEPKRVHLLDPDDGAFSSLSGLFVFFFSFSVSLCLLMYVALYLLQTKHCLDVW
jgi:hypothetical protein